MKSVLWLMLVPFLAGCARQPMVGAGEHKILQISILTKAPAGGDDANIPAPLRVGQRVALQVRAAWAIPYSEDVTDKVAWKLSDSALGEVDSHGVFTASAPGTVTITATLRVAERDNAHDVLTPTESAGGAPVVTFSDRMTFTVVK